MHVVTRDEALTVLPVLQRRAARLLEDSNVPGAHDLACALRLGQTGGNAIEGLNQNTDDSDCAKWPELLDSFWRVLVAFEENALGGELISGGAVRPPRHGTTIDQPRPWMLHAAADAIFHESNELPELADEYRAVEIPPYRRLVWG